MLAPLCAMLGDLGMPTPVPPESGKNVSKINILAALSTATPLLHDVSFFSNTTTRTNVTALDAIGCCWQGRGGFDCRSDRRLGFGPLILCSHIRSVLMLGQDDEDGEAFEQQPQEMNQRNALRDSFIK